MKMNKLAIAVGAAVLGMATTAQADLSGNIGVTSNYMFRGVTQTYLYTAAGSSTGTGNGDYTTKPAVSGGLDYSFGDSGFAVGTWTSSTGFGSPELDLYGSYSGEAGPLGYSVGVIDVRYPTYGNTSANFAEVNASLSYSILTVGYAHGVQGVQKSSNYWYASVNKDVGSGWSIGATVGHYLPVGVLSYTYGQVDISKSAGDYGDFTFSLSKAGSRAAGYAGTAGTPDPGVVSKLTPFVSWTKTF